MASFLLSAFGDEIADDLEQQLSILAELGVRHLELRGAWGKNVLDLNAAELERAQALLRQYGFGVSAIASPIGKSQLAQPRSFEQERLERAINAAQVLDVKLIRVFSFYYSGAAEQARDEVIARMTMLSERAGQAGLTLVHENEKDIFGDIAERCIDLMRSINHPALRMAFDPANFVQCGVRPMIDAWPGLAEFVTHVHIKDAIFADGSVRPAGQGDGAIPELIATLRARDYHGFLTLEPHLKVAGHSGGYSGPEGMQVAVAALHAVLAA
jgi:sugar phosphate isomerase/epimerase